MTRDEREVCRRAKYERQLSCRHSGKLSRKLTARKDVKTKGASSAFNANKRTPQSNTIGVIGCLCYCLREGLDSKTLGVCYCTSLCIYSAVSHYAGVTGLASVIPEEKPKERPDC